jgi:hypothetical protein
MEELEESLGDRKRNSGKPNPKHNRKTEYKNKKFGFGGQKKNSKRNTAESSADVFNKNSSNKWQRPSFHDQKGKKVGFHFFSSVCYLISSRAKNKNKIGLVKMLVKKHEQRNNKNCY